MKNKQFKIPEDYFNKFEEKIFSTIKNTKKEEEFLVPENYFENIESSIFKKIKKRKERNLYFIRTFSIAATLLLLFSLLIVIKNQNNSVKQNEIIDYLSDHMNSDELDEILLQKNINLDDKTISDKEEILNYIEDNDITDDELYNNI